MKKLIAMIFFAMLAGNAMAQAGGASSGAGGAGGMGGATGGTITAAVAGIAGVVAAGSNNSPSTSH
ncbi:MAG TPA: hypothetical protein VI363_11685 [Burkholderiales bacterium]